MKTILLITSVIFWHTLAAQSFTEVPGTPFQPVRSGSLAFADVDGDNDQDVLLTGSNSTFDQIYSILYTNDGLGNFTEVSGTPFVPVFSSSIAFVDIDGDNDQDLLITGNSGSEVPVAKLYTNDGQGNFSEVAGTPFAPVLAGSIAFADVDGDEDQDVVISGWNYPDDRVAILYLNDGSGNFNEASGTPFEGVGFGAIAFADIDGDNDQDLLVTGTKNSFNDITQFYINDGAGNFTVDTMNFLTGLRNTAVAFADVDGDDDQDFIQTGKISSGTNSYGVLYKNDGSGIFAAEFETSLHGTESGVIAFADVDGDNDQDVLISGRNVTMVRLETQLYVNDGSGIYSIVPDMPFIDLAYPAAAFTDVDGDTDQDLLLTGGGGIDTLTASLYTNDLIITSTDEILHEQELTFTLYPNPVKGNSIEISIHAEKSKKIDIHLIDLNGRLLQQERRHVNTGINNLALDISALNKGIYLLQIVDSGQAGIRKFTVQ